MGHTTMDNHLDEFGFCDCGNPSGRTEPINIEEVDAYGRASYSREPACADCFGLLR